MCHGLTGVGTLPIYIPLSLSTYLPIIGSYIHLCTPDTACKVVMSISSNAVTDRQPPGKAVDSGHQKNTRSIYAQPLGSLMVTIWSILSWSIKMTRTLTLRTKQRVESQRRCHWQMWKMEISIGVKLHMMGHYNVEWYAYVQNPTQSTKCQKAKKRNHFVR